MRRTHDSPFSKRDSMFDLRPQAQAHRAGHPVPDDGPVRLLRRRLLLPRRRHRGRRGDRRQRQDHAGGIRPRRCATSSERCAADDGPQLRSGDVRQPRSALRGPRQGSSTSSLLANKARDEHFRVSDAQLQRVHRGHSRVPGRRQVLAGPLRADAGSRAEHEPRSTFEQKLRQDMHAGAVQEPIAAANIVARPSAREVPGPARAAARGRRRRRSMPSRSSRT